MLEAADPWSIAKRMHKRALTNPRTGCVVIVGWDGKRVTAGELSACAVRTSFPTRKTTVTREQSVDEIATEIQDLMLELHEEIFQALARGTPPGSDRRNHAWINLPKK